MKSTIYEKLVNNFKFTSNEIDLFLFAKDSKDCPRARLYLSKTSIVDYGTIQTQIQSFLKIRSSRLIKTRKTL